MCFASTDREKVQSLGLPSLRVHVLQMLPTFEALAVVTIVFSDNLSPTHPCSLESLDESPPKDGTERCILVGALYHCFLCPTMTRIPALAVDGNSTFLVLLGTIEMNVGVSGSIANSPY
jgi:hypothetical protein